MPKNTSLPRDEQAAATKQKLLDTARTLFAKNGYAATTVRQLHRTAGLTDGILYYYFPDGKSGLFHALIEEELEQIVSDTVDPGPDFAGMPLEDVLEAVYQIWNTLLAEHYDIFRIMFCEAEVQDVVHTDELESILSTRATWLPRLLRERAAAGEIGEIDYEFAAEMIFSVMFDGLIIKVSNIKGGWLDDPPMRQAFFRALIGRWRSGLTG